MNKGEFYTNVFQRGNKLYVRSIDNGVRRCYSVDFQPTIWIESKPKSDTDTWYTLFGNPVYSFKPGNMYETREFVSKYNDVHNMQIYTAPSHVYQYLCETYPDNIEFNLEDVLVYTIDIETCTDYGFPEPRQANEKILLITVKNNQTNQVTTWGTKPYNGFEVDYICCDDEQEMLGNFVDWWHANAPDIVTGWNSTFFDITYLYNRMCKVIGESRANKLSVWNHVRQADVRYSGKEDQRTFIAGIASLDYLDLYKKWGTYSAKESYKLEYIAEVEIGATKLKNPGSTFKEFYTGDYDIKVLPENPTELQKKVYKRTLIKNELQKGKNDELLKTYESLDKEIADEHWKLFVQYNVRDVELVSKLDEKLKLIDLAMTIAYLAKINYEDAFSPVRTWDIIVYNYLNQYNIVVPPKKDNAKSQSFEGAYVKEPLKGKHNWCVSLDLTSLYPMIIQQYNMSPETLTHKKIDVQLQELVKKEADLSVLKEQNLAMAANGWCFRKDKKGVFPVLMGRLYDQRAAYKKQMIEAKKELEKVEKILKERETRHNQ